MSVLCQLHFREVCDNTYNEENYCIFKRRTVIRTASENKKYWHNGGQVADITLTGMDRRQLAHVGAMSIQVYPTITAQ